MSFLDAITEMTLRSTVSLTAARGRGKSAAIGICLAGETHRHINVHRDRDVTLPCCLVVVCV
jgi:tRNA(Met) C34 N-acetyltransferase TmcA